MANSQKFAINNQPTDATPPSAPKIPPTTNPHRRPILRINIDDGMVVKAVPKIRKVIGRVASALSGAISSAINGLVAAISVRPDPDSIWHTAKVLTFR